MDSTARFWDRIAERYAKQPVADEDAYREKLRITREYLEPQAELFEFGCGTGTTAIAHAPHVKQVRAIDVSGKMIAIARAKAQAAGISNLDFEQAAIDTVQVADASQDAVMGHSILHLLENRDAVIARAYAMLKPGGVFITSTACIGDMGWPYRLMGRLLPLGSLLGLLPAVKIFTEQALTRGLVAAGFTIEHQWRPGRNKAVFIVARK